MEFKTRIINKIIFFKYFLIDNSRCPSIHCIEIRKTDNAYSDSVINLCSYIGGSSRLKLKLINQIYVTKTIHCHPYNYDHIVYYERNCL